MWAESLNSSFPDLITSIYRISVQISDFDSCGCWLRIFFKKDRIHPWIVTKKMDDIKNKTKVSASPIVYTCDIYLDVDLKNSQWRGKKEHTLKNTNTSVYIVFMDFINIRGRMKLRRRRPMKGWHIVLYRHKQRHTNLSWFMMCRLRNTFLGLLRVNSGIYRGEAAGTRNALFLFSFWWFKGTWNSTLFVGGEIEKEGIWGLAGKGAEPDDILDFQGVRWQELLLWAPSEEETSC